MERMYNLAFMLAAQASVFAACSLVYLADEWLTVGYGLHPLLAGILTTAFLIWPYIVIATQEYE